MEQVGGNKRVIRGPTAACGSPVTLMGKTDWIDDSDGDRPHNRSARLFFYGSRGLSPGVHGEWHGRATLPLAATGQAPP